MNLYLRRTFSSRPIHANLASRDGAYASAVPDFPFGLKPDGRHYLLDGIGRAYLKAEDSSAVTLSWKDAHLSSHLAAFSRSHATQSRETIVAMINRANASVPWPLILLVLITGIACVVATLQVFLGGLILLTGIAASAWTLHQQHRMYVVTLEYVLHGPARTSAQCVYDAINALAICAKLWQVNESHRVGDIHEWKRQAGASALVSRSGVRCGSEDPPWVQCNIPVPCLKISGSTLYFFPDFILLRSSDGFSSLDYNSISLHAGVTRFIEEGSVPSDASIVDHTWQHPNKGGDPDKRFANNRQIPVCEYGSLMISASSNRLALLQTSHRNAASEMAHAFGKAVATMAEAVAWLPTLKAEEKGPVLPKPFSVSKHPTAAVPPPMPHDLDRMALEIEKEEQRRLQAFKRGSQ